MRFTLRIIILSAWSWMLFFALPLSMSVGHTLMADEPTPLIKLTYVYKEKDGVSISADVYRPTGTEDRPVVVWIHGGALIVGSRTQVPKDLLQLCTEERLILVSLDYRLAPEVKLPEIANDITDAFQWIHKQGPKLFHADTQKIVVAGGSAGGFLSMLAGVIVQPRPTALVAYWGYGDIDGQWATHQSEFYRTQTPLVDPQEANSAVHRGAVLTNTDAPAIQASRAKYYRYLRQTGGWSQGVTGIDSVREPEKLALYCPVHRISDAYPPILMIHGTKDTDVPYESSLSMSKELTRHRVTHELVTVPGAEHGLRDGDPQLVAAAHSKAREFILRYTVGRFSGNASGAIEPNRQEDLNVISQVGPQGLGTERARVAQQNLLKCGLEILPELLAAMDTSNSVALNWYRILFDEITARELTNPTTHWPTDFLKSYVNNSRIAGRPRRLVVSLLDRLEPAPKFSTTWLPTRLDDPEFRYEAIQLAIQAGDKALSEKNLAAAKAAFRSAFDNARDSNQVSQAASRLEAAGEKVDVNAHLGMLTEWWLIGPFDAPGKTGFQKVFQPEEGVDLSAQYQTAGGASLRWNRSDATDSLGQLNLITHFGTTREAVAYAYSEIELSEALTGLLGAGADDNLTVWLNGQKVLAREQWLNGTRFDRFVVPIQLRSGKNSILVKVCQGPQHKDPEVVNNWSLQMRLCDRDGKGLLFKSLLSPARRQTP